MARTSLSLATVFSSAQCVLSVVGSVGVILLFAGIPQLIYSPVVSVANLMTFLVGALLITTMVAGNSFLNYKYRSFERQARERRRAEERNGSGSGGTDPEDKPPSYDAIITSDGLPPDYFTIIPEKPPRYEEIVSEIFTINATPSSQSCTTTASPTPATVITTTAIATSSTSSPVEVTPSTITTTTCSSTPAPVEVDSLPKVFQIKSGARKEQETQETTVKGVISESADGVKKQSEESREDKADCKQQPNESADKENKHHEGTNTSSSPNQEDTKEGRGEDAERIKISDQMSETRERSECVTVTSFSASQNSTHLEESET